MEQLSSYSAVADEYYDSNRHPTCAHFWAVSARCIRAMLVDNEHWDSALEIGAGRSILADCRKAGVLEVESLEISDIEQSMLKASNDLLHATDAVFLLDSRDQIAASQLADRYDLIVSSLADPYDDTDFWKCLRILLRSGGDALITTPSLEWADAFRRSEPKERQDAARFETWNGEVWLPSLIRSVVAETTIAKECGFDKIDVFPLMALPPSEAPKAPKLAVVADRGLPVCIAYHVR